MDHKNNADWEDTQREVPPSASLQRTRKMTQAKPEKDGKEEDTPKVRAISIQGMNKWQR